MNNVSVCIDMMFADYDFYERFEQVKLNGINTAEFWKWSNKDINKILSVLNKLDMNISIFNVDSSNEKLSADLSRGIINDGRKDEFVYAIGESIPVYKKLNAKAMIVLIGDTNEYGKDNVYLCLDAVKPILERENVNIIVEPLNATDRKGYSMPYAKPVFDVLREVGSSNIKMLYDIYHQNMTGDFNMDDIKNNIDIIGHFHVADSPGRHEPGTGTIDYVSVLNEIKKLPYNGYIGLEYRATKPDSETFGFLKEVYNV